MPRYDCAAVDADLSKDLAHVDAHAMKLVQCDLGERPNLSERPLVFRVEEPHNDAQNVFDLHAAAHGRSHDAGGEKAKG